MVLFSTQQNVLISIMFMLISYLIGSIPFGLIFGKIFKHVDIRNYGSGNIGSTNSIRTLGKTIGIPVFLCEVLKGALVILLVRYVFDTRIFDNPVPLIVYGFFADMGHLFPIYLKFKGGKIVGPSLGIVLALTPVGAIACLICFVTILLTIGYVSIASCSAAITVVIAAWIQFALGKDYSNDMLNYLWGNIELLTAILYTVLATIIFIRHISNFKRLANGTEAKAKIKVRMEEKAKARKEAKKN
ncbi:MAG: glycerol-3-phosphate 1-O-acyltransferase PlsY [Acholeplasmatales bacterium]|nr:glycerol-3-phosphate 1-O-acyltransferase PlsY [Acholeplasmatales bacterium]